MGLATFHTALCSRQCVPVGAPPRDYTQAGLFFASKSTGYIVANDAANTASQVLKQRLAYAKAMISKQAF